jgi:uncharacterized membrane protein YheB (UPF0754 family)
MPTDLNEVWEMVQEFFRNEPDIWLYLIIPFTAAFMGWATNVIALKMTFYPIHFIGIKAEKNEWFGIKPLGWKGIGAIGWQGIIPSKAEVMAARAVDLMTGKLIDIKEQFAQIKPEVVAREMAPRLDELVHKIINEIFAEEFPLIWNALSDKRKQQVFQAALDEFPHVIEEVMDDVKDNIEELLDIKAMVVNELTKDKALLNEIFLTVGEKEFKFIEKSGIYFGFAFGVIQMVIWYFISDLAWTWTMLPIGGIVIGYVTNWLALKLIFEPVEPYRFMFVTFQGLFMKRQKEVSKAYSEIVATEILTTQNIFQTIMKGKGSEKLIKIVEHHIQEAVDKTAGLSRSLIQLTSGTKKYQALKQHTTERFIEELPNEIRVIFDYAEEALNIEGTMCEKMANLSPREFQGFLRPVFQEDELKLILVGAVLGGLAGLLQVVTLI